MQDDAHDSSRGQAGKSIDASVAQALGYGSEDRLVVVHVDDIGMSEAANDGALQALEGAATCGSIMVPCPAFEAAAELGRTRPDLDLGVHLTLNAEYETYRWDPVIGTGNSLCAPYGGMWRSVAETVDNASVKDVEKELRAQIERAFDAGIDVTHLDSHMGTVMQPKFIEVYVRLGHDYRLPVFLPRLDLQTRKMLSENAKRYVDLIDTAEAEGVPVFDQFNADSLEFEPETGLSHNRERIASFEAGISYLIIHCAQGGEQLSGITDDWRQRDEERRIYSDGSMAKALEAEGIKTIGMDPLRQLMRKRLPDS